MDLNLKGKKILVTGVGKGIGRDLAKTLAKLGAEVYGISYTQASLDSLKEESPTINVYRQDVADWDGLKKLAESLPVMDGLVNNAGIAILAPITAIEESNVDRSFAINVKSVINLSQTVAKKMMDAKKPGSIVNVSSQGSLVALRDHLTYCASKAALDEVTRCMALELGPYQIRTNSVNPTVVLTEMGRANWSDPNVGGPMLAKIPLGKFAEIDDVVNAILFLLSDKSGMITGTVMPIDGGFTAC